MSKRKKKRRSTYGGQLLEQVVSCLSLLGFQEVHRKDATLFERRIIKNWPYTTIYGTPGRREWCVFTRTEAIPIECKFQDGGGSVDEKMPYIARSFIEHDDQEMFVVFAGPYWMRGRGAKAVEWLRKESRQIKRLHGKTLRVFFLDDFLSHVKNRWG